jgi:ribosome-associated heat shock protein Hsp15
VAASSKTKVRIDKWLWAARFFKTRSQSAAAVKAGRVEIDGARAKPSHQVSPGVQIEVRKGAYRFDVEVKALAEKRGSAEQAAELYVETPASIELREQTHARLRAERAAMPYGMSAGRPTKKQRRQLMAFKEMSLTPEDWDSHDD